MSQRALSETFARLDALDPQRQVPVVASHAAYGFGRLRYNLRDAELRAIAARRGVVGLIACKHYMSDGLPEPATFDESIATICRHIDKIREGRARTITWPSGRTGRIHQAHATRARDVRGVRFGGSAARGTLRRRRGAAGCSGNALRLLRY